MKMSENVSNLFAALCQFQAHVTNPKKESKNPHFQSTYANLDEVITTIRPALKEYGLSFVQNPVRDENGQVGVCTILLHQSGEYIEFDPVLIPLKQSTPHQVGAAMTYARRYSLGAALGLATEEDDDANSMHLPQEKQRAMEHKKIQGAKTQGLQKRRFFAICSKKDITEKRQKAIIFLYTGRESRTEVTEEEYLHINEALEKASLEEIEEMVNKAAEKKRAV